MTPAGINKPLHLFIYIGGAVVVDKILSKTNHMQISFCFPASYFLLSCILLSAFLLLTRSLKLRAKWLLR